VGCAIAGNEQQQNDSECSDYPAHANSSLQNSIL